MNKALLVSALASHAAYAIKNCISPREEPEMTTLSKEDVVRWAEECVFDIMQADEYHAENEVIDSGNRWITDKMMTFATLSRADIVEANKALVAENEWLKLQLKAQTEEWHKAYDLGVTAKYQLTATRTALAAAEADNERLRDAIRKHKSPDWECNSDHPALNAALAKPRDDSALREMIAGEIDEFVFKFKRHVGGDGEFWLHELEDYRDSIRALAEKAKEEKC